MYSIQHYVIKFVSDLRQVVGFLRFHPPIKLITTYNWNIIESGIKHLKPNQLFTRAQIRYDITIWQQIIYKTVTSSLKLLMNL